VYATTAVVRGVVYPSVTNIGLRPTFESTAKTAIEVHILGIDADLYDQRLRLGFVQRLRDERRFPDVDALRAQIEADVRRAGRLFDRLSV
jgi:riboflavin kinase/FMN adenylyltransferase